MSMSKPIEELTVEDIEAFNAARQNTCESNHPLNTSGNFMDLLLEGSRMLVDEFRDRDDYKLDLGSPE